jgi:hypothetical protein
MIAATGDPTPQLIQAQRTSRRASRASRRPRAAQPRDASTSPPTPTPTPTPTPLLDAVMERGRRASEVPLHVPGHKRGGAAHPRLRQLLADGGALAHDLTELPGLDFLGAPSGPILAAQRQAARAFGADRTWFLVNGCAGALAAGSGSWMRAW